jgi:RAB protein geranylgeranyltransferase component A
MQDANAAHHIKVILLSQVVRAACILSHPIPSTNNAASTQIILPQKQVPPANIEQLSAAAVSRLFAVDLHLFGL